jgi:hypothetical protein
VIFAGAAQGYGGPDPAGWVVVDSTTEEGGGVLEYGHVIRRCNKGDHVKAGQIIAEINPNSETNGGTAPHLHLSDMPNGYDPNAKQDPMKRLAGAIDPTTEPPNQGRAPVVLPPIDLVGEQPMAWTGDPIWLEDVLRPALGNRLKTLDGWKNRGHGDFKDIRGVMVHHTGNSRESAQSIANGRPDLPGPLSQLHIAPDGTVTIVAVGVAWHAGQGSFPWLPANNANWHTIGIECAWPTVTNGNYNPNERWPDAQIIAMRDTCAALVKKLGFGADRVIGHKEWAGAAQGKWDPGNMDMGWFRSEVAKDLRGEFDGPKPPPPVQPGPVLPPNYEKEVWDQLRIRWPMLGDQTLVEAVAEVRDKVLGTSDKDKR